MRTPFPELSHLSVTFEIRTITNKHTTEEFYYVSVKIHYKSLILLAVKTIKLPVPMAARSKAYVCGSSPAEIVGSNTAGGMDVCLL